MTSTRFYGNSEREMIICAFVGGDDAQGRLHPTGNAEDESCYF